MDVRDFAFWMREAGVRTLARRAEAYSASLLPYQGREVIKARLDSIRWKLFDLEHEEEIDAAEAEASKRLHKMREERKAKDRRH